MIRVFSVALVLICAALAGCQQKTEISEMLHTMGPR